MVDDLSDFSKGQAFECFHCYKQVHIVIHVACCAYCLFLVSLYFCFRSCLLYIFCMYVFFSLDATILVNKDVYNWIKREHWRRRNHSGGRRSVRRVHFMTGGHYTNRVRRNYRAWATRRCTRTWDTRWSLFDDLARKRFVLFDNYIFDCSPPRGTS